MIALDLSGSSSVRAHKSLSLLKQYSSVHSLHLSIGLMIVLTLLTLTIQLIGGR